MSGDVRREPYFVSAGAERALTEAARTGRDINITGAIYRKVNHDATTRSAQDVAAREALARAIFAAPVRIEWQWRDVYDIADAILASDWLAAHTAAAVEAAKAEAWDEGLLDRVEAAEQAVGRVRALCDRWDVLTKGESPSTAAIRAAVEGRNL